ncbi:hypothetical protein EVAR_102409_1 [Eumeta japonica]|uniref:Uncharacterized protein n=1 Tax=Eumeta variegata TaxID=151549 RepID=A0A4C1Z0U6_EUMVA|nr:hypothetical protein EVAR_102409_1 [Eumeta japonica]
MKRPTSMRIGADDAAVLVQVMKQWQNAFVFVQGLRREGVRPGRRRRPTFSGHAQEHGCIRRNDAVALCESTQLLGAACSRKEFVSRKSGRDYDLSIAFIEFLIKITIHEEINVLCCSSTKLPDAVSPKKVSSLSNDTALQLRIY